MAGDFPELDGYSAGGTTAATDGMDPDDFLARERAALGEDAGRFGNRGNGRPTEASDEGGGGSADVLSPQSSTLAPTPAQPDLFDAEDNLDEYEPAQATGRDEIDAFESDYPALDDVAPIVPASIQNQSVAPAPTQEHARVLSNGSAPTLQQEGPEPEATRQWREDQARLIAEREEKDQKANAHAIGQGHEWLDQFYAEYNSRKEKTIAANKAEEIKLAEERDAEIGRGTTWERIAGLVELANSQSKTTYRGTRDLSRMKELLLSLKRDEHAPGAGGY